MSINQFKQYLRDEYRLKDGVDYSFVCKYGEIRVLCHRSFREDIAEAANKKSIQITAFFTYF